MQERHLDRFKYFEEQSLTTSKYVIPLLEKHIKIDDNISILEIGCGEGGNMKPFLDLGCRVVGVDLDKPRLELANEFYLNHCKRNQIKFIAQDIYDVNDLGKFDIIYTRDVVEHIHDQHKFMGIVKDYLKPNGIFFAGFPPWQNPFGGHQQICQNKWVSKLPFFHLLPKSLYKAILKIFGEDEGMIEALLEIKQTGISIERWERILNQQNYTIMSKILFLINPNYETKFGLKPRIQNSFLASIPWFRNFVTTCGYYIIKVK